jgi:hypothetical protein
MACVDYGVILDQDAEGTQEVIHQYELLLKSLDRKTPDTKLEIAWATKGAQIILRQDHNIEVKLFELLCRADDLEPAATVRFLRQSGAAIADECTESHLPYLAISGVVMTMIQFGLWELP